MPTPCWLKHLCSIRALVPVSFYLSLSPSLSFSGWSPGVQRLSEFTFLPRLLRPSREGALHLHPIERVPEASMNRASPMPGALLAFCINQGISASFSPLLSYRWLQTTRFQSIKGPQQLIRTYHIAQGTLLNTLSWPIWEIIFKRVDTYMFNWFTLLCIWN